MTAIVGVLCKDGVVLGADSSATLGISPQRPTIEQPFPKKITVIDGSLLVAGTGQIGLGQRFVAVLEGGWAKDVFKGSAPMDKAKLMAKSAIADFIETDAPKGEYGALVGFPCKGRAHLCEFALADFQPELKTEDLWYCSMGSAQQITDPFLGFIREVFWKDGLPSLQEGIFAVTWTLDHAIQVNPGGVNGPVHIGVLQPGKKPGPDARLLDDGELAEHRQNIEEAKNLLRGLKNKHQPTSAPALPTVPH